MYQLRDGRSEGESDGDSIPDPFDPPNRVAVFMAGSQSTPQSTVIGATAEAGAGGSGQALSPADVLSTLVEEFIARAMAEVAPADKAQHDAELLQLKGRIDQAREDLKTEKAMIAIRQAELNDQAFHLRMEQASAQGVRSRKYQSRLPPVYEATDLFRTPGAGTSNDPALNRRAAPARDEPVQQPTAEQDRQITSAPHVPTPPGHYSNPLDNIVATASCLAALPMEGTSPVAL